MQVDETEETKDMSAPKPHVEGTTTEATPMVIEVPDSPRENKHPQQAREIWSAGSLRWRREELRQQLRRDETARDQQGRSTQACREAMWLRMEETGRTGIPDRGESANGEEWPSQRGLAVTGEGIGPRQQMAPRPRERNRPT